MLTAFSTPAHRGRTRILLVTSALLAVGAGIVGIDDNPPGLLLAFISAGVFVTSFTHPWHSAARYRRLAFASVLVFGVATVLHNLFWALGTIPDLPSLARMTMNGLSIVFFFLAILVCPAAFLVGVGGGVWAWRRSGRG